MLYALILCDIAMAVTFFLKLSHLPPQIPLFYSRTFGEEQLTEFWYIFLLPLLMHIILFLNIYLYNRLFLPDQFFKRIVSVVNWFTIITLTFIFIKVILFIT